MAAPKHFNPKAGSPPYKSLFSNVTIAPAGSSLAFISTQWAADPTTGELMEGVENDYGKQSKIIWTNLTEILKELGVGMKEIVHVTVNFKLVISSYFCVPSSYEMGITPLIHFT
jgi:enamine deaminase RidA (YjgF/YER057c/UK114 family)